MCEKIYVGLNDNFHDPSICILNSRGELLFAEGIERPLQFKRGLGCPADMDFYIEDVIKRILPEQRYEVYVSSSWSKKRHIFLKALNFLGIFNYSSESMFYKFFNKIGAHRSFHSGSLKSSAALTQSGSGVFKFFNKWDEKTKVERKYFNHHICHLVNAISCSNIDSGLGLVIDGAGESTSVSIYEVKGKFPILKKSIKTTFSFGGLYGIVTNSIGFSSYKGEEWKVMGLAPYGKMNSDLERLFKDIWRVDGEKFSTKTKIMGGYIKEISDFVIKNNISIQDAAYTAQRVFVEFLFTMIGYAKRIVPNQKSIFISGGAALNSSAIGELSESGLFENIIVANAPADDGNSIGTAYLAFKEINGFFPESYKNRSPFLGSEINQALLEKYVLSSKLPFKKLDNPSLYAAELLSCNKIIGWIQGRAEFGPRALGNRSILAHPGYAENKDRINAVVKFRETFRPFAPSILHEYGFDYFEKYSFSPFMEKTLTFKKDVLEKVPAVVHVNNTGRLQSVTREMNEKYYDLILEFNRLTNIPLVVNTSYNVMGKPIVHDIHDVMAVFFSSSIDAVIINNYVIERKDLG